MNTMKMIAEIKSTCAALEAEKKELVSRVKAIDDNLTGYRMAIDALELTIATQKVVAIPEKPDNKEPVAGEPTAKPSKYGTKTIVDVNGKSQTISAWAKELGMTTGGILYRLNRGWPVQDAMTCKKSPGVTVIERKPRAKAAKKVFKYDRMNNPVRQYMSVADAARDLRMSETVVQKIIEHIPKGEQLKAHDWYLDYAK